MARVIIEVGHAAVWVYKTGSVQIILVDHRCYRSESANAGANPEEMIAPETFENRWASLKEMIARRGQV